MIKPKTNWFFNRITSFEEYVLRVEAEKNIDRKNVTFDFFSDYSFGSLDLFTFETSPKPIEKIFKMLHQVEFKDQGLNKLRYDILHNYAYDVGRVLGKFEFDDEIFSKSENDIIYHAFEIAK